MWLRCCHTTMYSVTTQIEKTFWYKQSLSVSLHLVLAHGDKALRKVIPSFFLLEFIFHRFPFVFKESTEGLRAAMRSNVLQLGHTHPQCFADTSCIV